MSSVRKNGSLGVDQRALRSALPSGRGEEGEEKALGWKSLVVRIDCRGFALLEKNGRHPPEAERPSKAKTHARVSPSLIALVSPEPFCIDKSCLVPL